MGLLTSVRKRLNRSADPRLGDILDDLSGTIVAGAITTSGTPGTTSTYAHGLRDQNGAPIAPYWVDVVGNGYVTAFDATNVTVGSTAASQALTLRIIPKAADSYNAPRKPNH